MFNKIKYFFIHKDEELRGNRWIFIIILIASCLSLIAAFVLSIEAIELIKNPDAQLGCSVNIIINCATVAKSAFASMFGFPNSFIGLTTEPIFIIIAIALLAGVKFPRKFMFSIQLLATMAFIFAYYLFFISTFIIHALCPWCLLVMLSTTVVFFAITRYNIRESNLYLSKKLSTCAKDFIKKDYDKLALAVLFVIVVAIIIIKYGNGLFA